MPYEPPKPNTAGVGPKASDTSAAKMADIHTKIDQTTAVMSSNIQSAMERGERLDDLQTKTESLADKSKQFHKHTKQVSKNLWLRNMKCTLILVFVVLLIISAVVGYIALTWKS